MSNVSFAANEYFYITAWNGGFSRAAMFRLTVGSSAKFESAVSRLVGPGHTSNTTPLSPAQLAGILASSPTWYSPRYSLPNAQGNGFSSVVSGMGQARWFWLDSILLPGQIENTDADAVFYTGPDTESFYLIFRSKCRLIEIANQENGCR